MAKYDPRWRQQLHEKFPQAILAKGVAKIPLKKGIAQDIRERVPDMTWSQIRRALRDYTGGPKYLKQCSAGVARIDLDGKPVSTVTAEEAAYAKAQLQGLRAFYAGRDARQAGAQSATAQ